MGKKEEKKEESENIKKRTEDNVENLRQGGLVWQTEKGMCYLGLSKHPAVENVTASRHPKRAIKKQSNSVSGRQVPHYYSFLYLLI